MLHLERTARLTYHLLFGANAEMKITDLYSMLMARNSRENATNSGADDTYAQNADSMDTNYKAETSPIIIGGSARSGTTLMRVMIDSHFRICCGPESRLFVSPQIDPKKLAADFDFDQEQVEAIWSQSKSRAEFIEHFFEQYTTRVGKERWAEKTPANILHLDYIFSAFPKTRFIHMVRDGRDVACSLRTFPRHKVVDGKLIPLNTWKPLDEPIEHWLSAVRHGRKRGRDGRYIEVKYEDLVLDTRSVMRTVLDFVSEPWDETILSYHTFDTSSRDFTKFPQNPEATEPIYKDAIGRWERDFSPEDKALFKKEAGDLLVELGYERSNNW